MHTKELQESQNGMKRKQIMSKKRIRKRRLRTGYAIIIAFLLGFILGKNQTSLAGTDSLVEATNETLAQASLQIEQDVSAGDKKEIVVSQPQKLSYDEAVVILTDLAGEDSRYADIVSNVGIYPETLLIQLTNNPEMIEFVRDYTEQKTNDSGVVSKEELGEKCPLLLQWDERWGYDTYGDNILAVSGCGPTALSMVIIGLTHNEKAIPAEIASFAMENDYYMYGTGTKWNLMSEGAAYYGLNSQTIAIDESVMQQCLDEGDFIICSMGPGDFTANGHFIVICGYDNRGFQVNDPFCIYRSGQTWDYEQLRGQIKSMWALEAD
jgi:hypothetical protein